MTFSATYDTVHFYFGSRRVPVYGGKTEKRARIIISVGMNPRLLSKIQSICKFYRHTLYGDKISVYDR